MSIDLDSQLRSFDAFRGSFAKWRQKHATELAFELWNSGACLAKLTYPSRLSGSAIASTSHGSWSIDRVGILNPRVVVRVDGLKDALAIYQPKLWGDGELELREGSTFRWSSANSWNTDWAFVDRSGHEVVRFADATIDTYRKNRYRIQHTMTLVHVTGYRNMIPLLSCLGMYLIDKRQWEAVIADPVRVPAAA